MTDGAPPPADLGVDLHAVMEPSRANGPGRRRVIWFQGCDLGCRGCFNPETHAFGAGLRRPVSALIDETAAAAGQLDGLTISGGEPFRQPQALLALVIGVRARTDLSILVFSGFRRREIEGRALGPDILDHVDVLVAGRYIPSRHQGDGLLGSANQRVHLLTDRHSATDIATTPAAEIIIDAAGQVIVSGVAPPDVEDIGASSDKDHSASVGNSV